jgi:hypothetical protein
VKTTDKISNISRRSFGASGNAAYKVKVKIIVIIFLDPVGWERYSAMCLMIAVFNTVLW